MSDWRELERARLAADPTIRRVSWRCDHAPRERFGPGGRPWATKGHVPPPPVGHNWRLYGQKLSAPHEYTLSDSRA